ncbi:YheT family hydrolase [Oleisolibacter albus]|uniref:YheT family hydrolase n=1 Tax=Oleisolibacter albus TaxID=2171757 RepID=UPI000DF4C981|nr:alpha/beta fold hydrolase [Oleisolibacter albus]
MPDRLGRRPAGPLPVEPFRQRFPWIGAHLQTVRNTLVRPRFPLEPGERLDFPMPDGSGDSLLARLNRPSEPDAGRPLVLLVHGLSGCDSSYYMLATAQALIAQGYPVLRLNLRGAGPGCGMARQRYHAGRTDDLRAVLAQLPADLTAAGVVPVGYSLGGNAVLKLLGEGDLPALVVAGASVSAPIDLAAASRRFLDPGNRPYHSWLLGKMKQEMAASAALLEPRWLAAAAAARSVWEFDDTIVGPWNGWSGAEEYYRVNSARQFLQAIPVPTLIIHALDDPWIPGASYQAVRWRDNPDLLPLLPAHGGHVGFHGRGGPWHDRCLLTFLAAIAG